MRFSTRVNDLSGDSVSVWDVHTAAKAAKARGEDAIVMSVGDPDFATPGFIVEAAAEALRGGDTHYTGIAGREALRQEIATDIARRGGPDYGVDNVIVTAGAQNALFSASLCLLSPGDEVVVLDPMYVTYEAALQASGATIVRVVCGPERGFRPDLDALEKAITPRTRALFYANPNNPTGVAFSAEELEGIADIARRHDIWVVSDEVYADLTFERDHTTIAALGGMRERTVTLGSVSKSHAMTGWRCGWLAGPAELISHARNLALCMNYGLPGFIQEAAAKGIAEGRGDVERMCDIYRRRRDLVADGLKDVPGMSLLIPEAGMFLVADIRATGMDAARFSSELYAQKRVSVLNGAAFGAALEGFVRISFAASEADLEEGCKRIREFIADIA